LHLCTKHAFSHALGLFGSPFYPGGKFPGLKVHVADNSPGVKIAH
jgi:hypothetical protein